MIDWKGEDLSPDKDGSIERYQMIQGKDYITPQEGALVNGKYNYLFEYYLLQANSKLMINLSFSSTFNWNI